MTRRRPVCTHENYIKAVAAKFLEELPERVEELLGLVSEKDWPGYRRSIEVEMDRQRAEDK